MKYTLILLAAFAASAAAKPIARIQGPEFSIVLTDEQAGCSDGLKQALHVTTKVIVTGCWAEWNDTVMMLWSDGDYGVAPRARFTFEPQA